MIGTSVTTVLDRAGITRHTGDGRTLLVAERVELLVLERDAARAGRPRGTLVLEPLAENELASVAEWGRADTGRRATA